MNCDRIAPFYQFLEKLTFGARLQQHRIAFLKAAAGKQRVLIVGDGDGRFTQALAKAYPDVAIDCVEVSAGMLAQTRKRLPANPQVRLIQADARCCEFRGNYYQAVFTHFFLDCFATDAASLIVRRVSQALTREAVWVVSDFRQAHSGWRKFFTLAWLNTMYLFFRHATGLETRRLPEYGSALQSAGFHLSQERVSMAGLIASEWWQR
jgi:ubiquinone/menaquinone biosynthesis C-methylase UbiE